MIKTLENETIHLRIYPNVLSGGHCIMLQDGVC